MTGYFIVNNKTYYPKSIKQTIESLASENSGRTEDGVMHISYLKRKLRKWEIELPPITQEELENTWQPLLAYIQGNPQYQVYIYDILTNGWVSYNVYTSNMNGDMYSGVLYNGMWTGIKFSMIGIGNTSGVD